MLRLAEQAAAVRVGERRPGGTGCRRRPGCRSAARAARSRTCSRRSSRSRTCRSSRITLLERAARSRGATPAQVVVEVRELARRPDATLCRLRRSSHCAAKLSTSAFDRGSREHAADLRSSTPAPSACPASASCEQLVVRDAAPQEERQPRGELDSRRPRRPRPGATLGGSGSSRNRKLGLVEDARAARSRCRRRSAVALAAGS